MPTPTTDAFVKTLEEAVAEIEKINKSIILSKQLKESDPTEAEHMDVLVKKYVIAKAEVVEEHRKALKELRLSMQGKKVAIDVMYQIKSKEAALSKQSNQAQTPNTELKVEENAEADKRKIASAMDVVSEWHREHSKLTELKEKFLLAVEMHGFDPVNLLHLYETIGICPKCKGSDTAFSETEAGTPTSRCLSCGNVWNT